MNRTELITALLAAYPGSNWKLNGDTYHDLVWLDKVLPKPTEPDLQDLYADLVAAGAPTDEQIREYKHARSKQVAYEKITAILPEWKQRNLLAYGLEFVIGEFKKGRPITADDMLQIDGALAVWQVIKDIRAASDLIEAELALVADPENYSVEADNPLWP